METKRVIIGNPLTVAGVTLMPVIEVSISHWQHGSGLSFFGNKQVIGVVILSPGAKRAFRITGEEVPLDQIATDFPEIREALEWV